MSKTRPAHIVISDLVGVLPLKFVVPITAWQPLIARFPWMVPINPDATNGLSKASAADTFQVRCLSETRFVKQIGEASATSIKQIETALAVVLENTP